MFMPICCEAIETNAFKIMIMLPKYCNVPIKKQIRGKKTLILSKQTVAGELSLKFLKILLYFKESVRVISFHSPKSIGKSFLIMQITEANTINRACVVTRKDH